ncbi:DUF2255 family protein [Streptomyces sp. NPDC051776]|uniref:DUF2255 family protein n=1 Tax=Streptomyces sp. NPDC051776 TaxID=3155414 RepID=UPI003424A79D
MDVTTLDHEQEIAMRTRRRDGSWSSRPIWVVVVDQDAYVRSYRGREGDWYKRARAEGSAEIQVGNDVVPVGLEAVHDEALNRRVSEAYRDKYAKSAPGPTESMIGAEALETTLVLRLE